MIPLIFYLFGNCHAPAIKKTRECPIKCYELQSGGIATMSSMYGNDVTLEHKVSILNFITPIKLCILFASFKVICVKYYFNSALKGGIKLKVVGIYRKTFGIWEKSAYRR